MAYIGRDTDKISNVEVLDNITFDGSSSYTLQKNSVNFTPSSANTLLVSIDGVVQAGNFTVSGSTIDFGTAVAGTSTCDFILHYGVGLITTPADGTVTNAKINYPLAESGATVSTFNRTTSDGTILELQKDGTAVGSIGVASSKLHIASVGNSGIRFRDDLNSIIPCNSDGSNSDNDQDLGYSTVRWRRLYLSEGAYLGGTGTANLLDDYEEGTFTPSFSGGVSGSSYAKQEGKYTKIGNQCYFQIQIKGNGLGATTGQVTITGLPFGSASDAPYGGAIINYNVNFKGDGDITCHKGGGDLTLYFYQYTGSGLLGTEASDINGEILLNGFYRTT
jgi:hypothetical protein